MQVRLFTPIPVGSEMPEDKGVTSPTVRVEVVNTQVDQASAGVFLRTSGMTKEHDLKSKATVVTLEMPVAEDTGRESTALGRRLGCYKQLCSQAVCTLRRQSVNPTKSELSYVQT